MERVCGLCVGVLVQLSSLELDKEVLREEDLNLTSDFLLVNYKNLSKC